MEKVDVVIIGGGLAGLTAAIHLHKKGISSIIFEKNSFPHHKVCGEYVSNEILPYLQFLEIPVHSLNPVKLNRLFFSTSTGDSVEAKLPLGGIGMSRYAFDNLLFEITQDRKIIVCREVVTEVTYDNDFFVIKAGERNYSSRFVIGAFGKRSNLDKVLARPFFRKAAPWLAVKAHYKNESFPEDLVALHNFKGGYCGLSRTESGAVNACYLATYKSFKNYKKPELFQQEVLYQNPYLKAFFTNSKPQFEQPLTIAQVSFQSKASVRDHILFVGDAAGLIHPLCGNGMAMAMHSAKIAAELISESISDSSINRSILEKEYAQRWNRNFNSRIRNGKLLQRILLNQQLSKFSQRVISKFPFLLPQIIKSTHGNPIV